jgi:GTP-binding protein YchF
MKLGIIGLPGSGRSTLFESLTHLVQQNFSQIPGDRIGTIKVPDKRVDVLSEAYHPRKTIYAQVEYLLPDMVGHKKDNSKEPVWSAVRVCDALIHVIRNFEGYGSEAPEPLRDFHLLDEEMIFADLVVVEKRLERLRQDVRRGLKINLEEQRLLIECRKILENGQPLRREKEMAAARILKGFTFLSAKPVLVLFNNDVDNDSLPEVGGLLEQENCQVVRGRLEHELAQLDENEAQEYLAAFGIDSSAMDRVIARSYELLGLISFFTVGEDEVRAWTIKNNTAAPDAAEVIHSDLKKGFIRAEVVSYDDLVAAGSRKAAKKKGAVRLEGKSYEVRDGDVIEFRFNVYYEVRDGDVIEFRFNV